MATKESLQPCTDEEYLSSVFDFAQSLTRDAVIKATKVSIFFRLAIASIF